MFSVNVRVATQMMQLLDSLSSSVMCLSSWEYAGNLSITILSALPVLLGGSQQPFKEQGWHCAALAQGRCWLAAQAGRDALQQRPAKRMGLETKERGSLGQRGKRRAKEDIYLFDILLSAPGKKNIHESPSGAPMSSSQRP